MVEVAAAEKVRRLQAAGFVIHRTANELRQVREQFPGTLDELGQRLLAVEEESRTLAGLVAMELRELEEAGLYGSGSGRAA